MRDNVHYVTSKVISAATKSNINSKFACTANKLSSTIDEKYKSTYVIMHQIATGNLNKKHVLTKLEYKIGRAHV